MHFEIQLGLTAIQLGSLLSGAAHVNKIRYISFKQFVPIIRILRNLVCISINEVGIKTAS